MNQQRTSKYFNWKQMKDLFASIKSIASVIRDCLKIRKRGRTIHRIDAKLQEDCLNLVQKENGMFNLIKKYMMKRSKQRFQYLTLIRNIYAC
jgi:hypothetical protein